MNLEFLIAMLKSGKKTTDRCFCFEFMRILKYKMKGFFETISLEKEINRAKYIESLLFEKNFSFYKCKACERPIFIKEKTIKKFYDFSLNIGDLIIQD